MFTRDQLRARLPELLTAVVPVGAARFDHLAFDPPDGEESIAIYRSTTSQLSDPMRMWVASAALQWPDPPAGLGELLERSALCQPLSEPAFNQLVSERSAGLIRPLPQPLHAPRGFVGALQMLDEWNDVAAIAAYDDELLAFFWSTTA